MSVSTSKKMVSFRLSESDIQMLDYIQDQLTKEYKVNFDRTKTIEYCIRWEYDRKYNTNNASEYVETIASENI